MVAALTLGPLPLAEAHPNARLQFTTAPAAGECPSAEALRAAVVAHLGYDPFTSDAAETIVASVDRAPNGALRGSIERYDAKGKRRGHQDIATSRGDCAQIASAIALGVSVAIDPIGAAPAPPASTPPLPPPEPPPAQPPATTDSPQVPPEQPALPTGDKKSLGVLGE
jgi:hypothetical protein